MYKKVEEFYKYDSKEEQKEHCDLMLSLGYEDSGKRKNRESFESELYLCGFYYKLLNVK